MTVSRRQFLLGALAVGASTTLAACSSGRAASAIFPSASATASHVRNLKLVARPVSWDLGGRVVETWAYGDTVPGAALRATAGDRVQIAFKNELPTETSVHWHGLAIKNSMDGVPGVTTPAVASGQAFAYDFTIPHAGTHWFHPHTGLQLDRGLYAPFIVDDPNETGAYDHEWVVVLDDWTDGVGKSPEQIYAHLTKDNSANAGSSGMGAGMGMGMNMGGMDMSMDSGGDVTYPLFLVNGKAPNDPDVFTAKPGQRVRIRMINASADTVFIVALAGHHLSVTHTDGYEVVPFKAQSVMIGMGERYDVVTTLGSGVFTFAAAPFGKKGVARALVRTASGATPPVTHLPSELNSNPVTADLLRAAPSAELSQQSVGTLQNIALSGSMTPYVWTINGRTYDRTVPLRIARGELGRFQMLNMSMMWHPIHIHGHTFQIGEAGKGGARKDTILVPAMGSADVDLLADNPGKWMVHCHNAYHAEAGMMTRLEYV